MSTTLSTFISESAFSHAILTFKDMKFADVIQQELANNDIDSIIKNKVLMIRDRSDIKMSRSLIHRLDVDPADYELAY